MRRLTLLVWLCAFAALTVVGAYYLTLFVDTLPFNMPYWLDVTIRFGFAFFLHDDMPDPDDMGGIALLFYFACAMVVIGTVVGIVALALWRRVLSRRLPHANRPQ